MNLQYWNNTWQDMREQAKDYIAVAPIGAVEQHGPRLPLGTDCLINNAYTARLQGRCEQAGLPFVFLPLMPYGKSNEHLEYPGTVTLSAKTLLRVLLDVAASCARAGFTKLVFLNTHGGNHEIIDMAVREVRVETGIVAFAVQPSRVGPKDQHLRETFLSERERRMGIHAGKAETSLILSIDPTLVKDKGAPAVNPTFEGYRYLDFTETVPFGWMTQDVSSDGSVGDPTGATAEGGERWLNSICDAVIELFYEIVAFQPYGNEVKQ